MNNEELTMLVINYYRHLKGIVLKKENITWVTDEYGYPCVEINWSKNE